MLSLFASLTPAEQRRALRAANRASSLPDEALRALLLRDWRIIGREKQFAPLGDWTYWFIRAGRGFGKTLSAAQWARERGLESPVRFALVAPTFGDGRDTMVEGETGLLKLLRPSELRGGAVSSAWNRSTGELFLANKTKYKVFSSEEPNRIRGPQHHYAWCEEVSSWKDAWRGDELESTWSNVKLSTRLGDNPQFAITSTPKPNKLTKQLVALPAPRMRLVIGSSYENRANLAAAWWNEVIAPYEGTRTGRQEILAELLEDVEGALWSRALLDALRVTVAPELARVVVSVDPNVSSGEAANEAGIIVSGRARPPRDHAYVLADRTEPGGPAVWAQAAVDAYYEHEADLIVAERNNGGEMVEMVIKAVDPDVPVKLVSASRGKRTRAEPVATLYAGSHAPDGTVIVAPSVHHVGGDFEDLEDQMVTWTPDADSPDRMDALVWGLTELMLLGQARVIATSHVPRGRIAIPERR